MAGSGANTVRLSKLNPLLGSGRRPTGGSLLNPSYLSGLAGQPPPPLAITSGTCQQHDASHRKRKDYSHDAGHDDDRREKRRRSRWGADENDKTFIPGMPTILPTNLDSSQEQAYLIQLQIEDYTRRLRSGDLGIPSNPEQRSPSPEPIYGTDGKRLNTRDYRTRRRLEDERHKLIQKMSQMNTEYKPPADYKPPSSKIMDKIVIPQDEHPDINFVGLLIGPRGNTLKSLERESGAKIIIRGKGSVKEGKVGRKDGLPMPGEDEPLHALISSVNPECVQRAVKSIKEIIRQGVELPDGQNDLRRNQLRELALLNGTLRDQDGQRCANCGATSHKTWQCQDKLNVTNNIICTSCGAAGHLSRDCRQRRGGGGGDVGIGQGAQEFGPTGLDAGDRAKIDEEYLSLMAELGEGPPPRQQEGRAGGMTPYGGGRAAARPLLGGGGGGVQRWPGPPPRPLLNQPPPSLSGPPPAVNSQPPQGWGGPATTQGPPPTLPTGSTAGPETGSAASCRPPGTAASSAPGAATCSPPGAATADQRSPFRLIGRSSGGGPVPCPSADLGSVCWSGCWTDSACRAGPSCRRRRLAAALAAPAPAAAAAAAVAAASAPAAADPGGTCAGAATARAATFGRPAAVAAAVRRSAASASAAAASSPAAPRAA